MGNPSPLRLPNDFGSLKTIPEVVRYVTAFAKEVSIQFNTLLGNKDVWGSVGISGTVGATGSGNFVPSLLAAGSYWISFREPYFVPPVCSVTPATTSAAVSVSGVTTVGFSVLTTNLSGTLTNVPFHFMTKGVR